MPPGEREAYGRIAEAMSERLRSWQSFEPGNVLGVELPIPCLHHMSQSSLEWCSEHLVRLGILAPVDRLIGTFTFSMDQASTYDHAILQADAGPPLEELLAAFLYHASGYGGGFRAYRTDPFPVCKELDSLFRSLTTIGYLQRRGCEYQWTDKARPVMERAWLWVDGEEDCRLLRRR